MQVNWTEGTHKGCPYRGMQRGAVWRADLGTHKGCPYRGMEQGGAFEGIPGHP